MKLKHLVLLPILAFATIVAVAGVLFVLNLFGPWDGPQSALDPKGPVAHQANQTFMVTLVITTFLWVTVGGTMLYTVWRFRQRKTDDPNAIPKQSHGHPAVEAGLIAVSALFLVIIAVPTLRGIVFMKALPVEHSEDAIEVNVTGWQWWWEFEYPEHDGLVTANELVIPVGKAVKLNLNSGDVIHSFWLPKLAGKLDLMPGQTNFMWIKADEPGMYYGQCAEFCGDSHAYMLFRARAVPQEEYDAWVQKYEDGPVNPLDRNVEITETGNYPADVVSHGREVFNANCVSCHSVGDTGGVTAPNLSHFASRSTIAAGWLDNTPENLYKWIRHPEDIKPGNYMYEGVPVPGTGTVMPGLKEKDMTDEEVEAVVAYLTTLK